MISDRMKLKNQIKELENEVKNYTFANDMDSKRIRATLKAQLSLLKKRLSEYKVITTFLS